MDMKRYVLEVQEDEHTGECYVTFPDELLEETGWVEGTTLEWSEEIDGSIVLKKVEE
jgi:bifunctional DNA-binding transcriptional regulator/antitoxin component of YhaV-PrlF toxin-antitoxin module